MVTAARKEADGGASGRRQEQAAQQFVHAMRRPGRPGDAPIAGPRLALAGRQATRQQGEL